MCGILLQQMVVGKLEIYMEKMKWDSYFTPHTKTRGKLLNISLVIFSGYVLPHPRPGKQKQK